MACSEVEEEHDRLPDQKDIDPLVKWTEAFERIN